MSENQNNNRKKLIPKAPKPNANNYQVWLIAGLLMLIFVVTWFSGKSSVEPTSEARFFQMLSKGEVARVVFLQGENVVEFYLKSEIVNKNSNSNDPARPSFSINQGKPHYNFRIIDAKTFQERFEASQK
ncbi:MAG: hypothetical protein H7Y04_05085, partial [Verrucomicrobia bacterium]|nr:hypothetical protein [Cytophagales bacterium]